MDLGLALPSERVATEMRVPIVASVLTAGRPRERQARTGHRRTRYACSHGERDHRRHGTNPARKEPLMTAVTAQPLQRPPLPPFTRESAVEKVRLAEDAWNSRDPERVSLAYTVDSRWRNRAEIFSGRDLIVAFLTRKWGRELDYRLIKELWAYDGDRIAVRFAYEWRDDSNNWYRAYGNENWEFDDDGLMRERHASINDLPIQEADRLYRWPLGRRPDDHHGLSDLGL
jgi:uncharacterized protein